MDLSPYARLCLLSARAESRSPWGRNLVVAKSALLRFRPRTAKTALHFLAPPFPTEPASLGFGGGPKGPPVREPAKTKGLAGTLRQKEKTRIDLAVYPGLVRPKPEVGKGACGTFSPYGSLPKKARAEPEGFLAREGKLRKRKGQNRPCGLSWPGAPQSGAALMRRTSVFAKGENLGAGGIHFRRALK